MKKALCILISMTLLAAVFDKYRLLSSAALKQEEEQFFSESELDLMLPPHLRKNVK